MSFNEYWEQIFRTNEKLNVLLQSYWHQYSYVNTWQFWTVMALLVVPLIILYFTVDRTRIFELLFFGYTVHILWSYIGMILEKHGYFIHMYFLAPILPFAVHMNAAALPVGFLLLYQYCTGFKKRNFYFYAVLLSVGFAFGVASIEQWLGFLEFRKGMNHFHLVLIDLIIVYSAYWLTTFILSKKESKTGIHEGSH